ncbi:MAG TPA: tRNA (adenosine(37)-N6)-dimethylallyltransferase MiaA [Candidatus Paceibacterota bacterium]
MSINPRLIAIVGPTASGKTTLAIALAQKFGGEIVSADSRQLYRGMDIGTAKPSEAECRAIPHHLIDIKDPDEDYAVAEYQHDAVAAIDDIIARGKVPFLVGGTGLYVRAVVENLDIPKTPAHPELRAEIERDIAREGLDATFKRLVALDPDAAQVVDPKNPRRVVRALEVALASGAPFTAQRTKSPPLFNTLVLGLNPPPGILRERIDRRVDEMFHAGFVDEVKTLMKKYGSSVPAFNAIGYREIIDHLNGGLSIEDAAAAIKLNTWHYAKRQVTWFKKYKPTYWVASTEEASTLVKDLLK